MKNGSTTMNNVFLRMPFLKILQVIDIFIAILALCQLLLNLANNKNYHEILDSWTVMDYLLFTA
jgi:hypothetical protein